MSEKYKSDFTGFQVDDSVDRAKIGGILENQIIQRLFKLENTGEYVYSHNGSVQTQIPISKTFDISTLKASAKYLFIDLEPLIT